MGQQLMTSHRAGPQSLSPERWKALEPIVDAALALPLAARPDFFDRASDGDSALRAEIESMVAECEQNDPSLDRPAAERFASLLESTPAEAGPRQTILAGRFRIERELGRGGMAAVFLAHDLKHARDVALKMVHPELAELLGGERFIAEIRVTATLRHPHILPLFDSGEADGSIYFVMPYVEGGTLRDRLTRERKLPLADALRIASQVADGLSSAHEHGIVHRDIKPENILLAAGGRHAYVADFGIAVAVSRADSSVGAASEIRFGTPAYMSPEQFEGSSAIDARTDVYSLGCVLHEMLLGAPPRPGAGMADADSSSAPSWRRQRYRDLDSAVERVLRRALAIAPADRFQSVDDFRVELTALATNSLDGRTRLHRLLTPAVVAAAIVIASIASSVVARMRGAAASRDVDPDLIVVLPFRGDSTGRAILSGENAARLLYDALGRWTDLKLGDEMAAVEAGRRKNPELVSLTAARAIARRLGAGKFVWGEVTDQRGTARISAQLYDERRPADPVTHVAYLSAGDGAAAAIEEIADSLVAKLVGKPAAGSGASGTRMFAALKRYAEGYAALHEWNTELAKQDFAGAVDLDPRFPQAWLGLAQSMAWSGEHRAPEWREAAARAVADSEALAPRDRLLARGLLALSEWRMADACDVYRALIARDPRDFAAHFGLGDCLSMDRLVVVDPKSPTGWRFRGSLHTAIREYLRALDLVPSYLEGSRGQTFARLTNRILFNDPGIHRRGFALTPDTVWMGAYPEIENDTLAFHPRPRAEILGGFEPPTHQEAIARNRQQLRMLTARWVTAFPQSATAWEQHAMSLESLGVLDTLDETRRGAGALGAIATARRLGAVDSLGLVRQIATHARILLKLRRFGAAEALIDSAIVARPTPSSGEANLLAPLAALTGRARLTAQLLAVAAGDVTNELFSDPRGGGRPLPAAVLTAAGSYAGFAALGAPLDSLRVARDRADRMIRSWVMPRDLDAVRTTVFLTSDFQAQPALGAALMTTLHDPGERMLPSWQALAGGDTVNARRLIGPELVRQASSDAIPAPDVLLQYSLLALAVRDTAAAMAVLDRVINTLPELESRLTTEVFPAAALPRVLWLRSRLTQGIPVQRATSWSSAKVLWLHADPELRVMSDSIGAGRPGPRTSADGSQRASPPVSH